MSVAGITEVRAAMPLAGTLAAVREATDAVVIVMCRDLPPVERAMLIGAIGPLAIELAPARRLCALDIADGALETDVAAAVRYLAGARSTTGQVLAIV